MARDDNMNNKEKCGNCEHYGDRFCILWLCHTSPEDRACNGYEMEKEDQ